MNKFTTLPSLSSTDIIIGEASTVFLWPDEIPGRLKDALRTVRCSFFFSIMPKQRQEEWLDGLNVECSSGDHTLHACSSGVGAVLGVGFQFYKVQEIWRSRAFSLLSGSHDMNCSALPVIPIWRRETSETMDRINLPPSLVAQTFCYIKENS